MFCSKVTPSPTASPTPSPTASPTPSPTVQHECTTLVNYGGGGAALDATYWHSQCASIPAVATSIQVTMGSVVDYFKPTGQKSLCEMLQSYNSHQWSADANAWRTPAHYHTHSGGSAKFWPRDNIPGDSRAYLPFWGGHQGG